MSEAFSNALLGAEMEDEEFTLQTRAAPLGRYQRPETFFDIRNPFTTGINSFNSTYRNANAAWRAHTFIGQIGAAYEAAQLVNEENEYDPDWDLWEHLTDSEKAAARASGYEELSALRTPQQLEQYRLVKAANGFYRDELSDANPATVFISSMIDLDALAPLGVTRGIGFWRGAARGATYVGVAAAATESARIDLDPEAKPEDLMYASAALLVGGALGGVIGKMRGREALGTIRAQEDLSSQPVSRGDIEEAADSMDEVYEQTLHRNGMGPRPEPRPEDIGPMEAEARRVLDEADAQQAPRADEADPQQAPRADEVDAQEAPRADEEDSIAEETFRAAEREEPAARSEPETVLDAEDEVALNKVLQAHDAYGQYKSLKGQAFNEEQVDAAKKLYIDLVDSGASTIMPQVTDTARLGRKYGVLVGDGLTGADSYATLKNLETLAARANKELPNIPQRRSDEEPPPWEEAPRGSDPDTQNYDMASPETDNFKSWFRDSKVVDEKGDPRVLYHGTMADFETFSVTKGASNTGSADARMGFFFTDNPNVAKDYLNNYDAYKEMLGDNFIAKLYGDINERLLDLLRLPLSMKGRREGKVLNVYLSMKNPFVLDMKGKSYNTQVFRDTINAAKDAGHDGVIFKNVSDPGWKASEESVRASGIYIPFRPEQIKAVDNRGRYDPDNPNMYEMAATDGVPTGAAPASRFTPIDRDEGGLWQPKKNPITRMAAQLGRQFPYMKNIENQFFEMGEDATPLANKISQTAQKLGGTVLPNKNGDAEIGLMYRHHQLYKVMDDHLTQISEIYNAHRGRTAGKGGAARMMMSEVADKYQNLKGRAQGEGKKSRVKFTHEDYMNWIWYPAAYNFNFDATMSYGLKTVRERFAEEGWGQAEWDVLSKGSQESLRFFEKISEMMDADAMKGSAAALKRAEQYEDYAVFLRERSVKHDDSRKAVVDDEKAYEILTKKHRTAFAESLEFDAAAIAQRIAAGDPEIAATMYSSLIRVALKQHLKTLKPLFPDPPLSAEQMVGLQARTRPDNPRTRIEDALELDARSPQDAVKMRKVLDETLQVEGIEKADSAIIIDRRYDGNNPSEWTMRQFNKRLEELETQLFHATIKRGRDLPRRDPNYFARLIRPDVVDDPSINKFLQEEMFRAFQQDPTLRGRTLSQNEKAIQERVNNTINNMRRRGVRADTEGLLDADTGLSPFVPKHEMSRRNPLRDRQLLMDGPGNSVLETDPRIVMNAYLNRVGPSMSMTREYGDPSAWRAIREIDYDAEDLAIEAMKKGDWKTAARIEREGREQVAALTDLRDGVLGTWGFHEDPTTLSARTLRTAKNIGVVTLMGRSGQMVAADAGRLMLAMKLKELGDMGLMAFKSPQEFGLAWNEIKLMGEVAEARSQLRTGWLIDATGGSMARASAFENFWQRLTGPTFVVSGLAPGTDMLKGITGVHTMSEIIRLSKAHAEGTIGLMSKELPETIGEWTIVSMKGIPPQPGRQLGPYARADNEKKIIYYDEDKIRAAYKDRQWASQSYLDHDGAPDPMPIDAFKTEEHWMRHILLHEWMHTKYPRNRGESIKAYENRINQEAFNRLPYHNPPEKGEIDMAARLKELGITDDLARRINDQWEKAGSQGPGNGTDHFFIANSEKWDDQEVIDLFRGAVSQEVNKIIITPNVTTRPKLMSTNLWSYLLQFKSFPIAASFAATARMIQSPKEKRVRRMALGMLAGGFLVQNLRASPFDEDDIDKYMRVVDYSGVVPLFSEINNISELLTAGTVGMRPLFGSESVLRDVNVAEQIGPFLGPVGGSLLRLGGTLPEGDLGEITKAATRFVPWANHPANFFPGFMRGLGELAEGEE